MDGMRIKMVRKGMGKGKGKGYKNIIGKDPRVHSDSAKGRKQPQKFSPRVEAMLKKNPSLKNKSFKQLQKSGVFLKYQADADGDGVPNIKDCKPLDVKKHKDMPVTEIKFDPTVEKKPTKTEKIIGKAGALAGRGLRAGKELAVKEYKSFKQKKEEKRIKELEEVKHPLIQDLEEQRDRVSTLQRQIQQTDDEEKEEKLFDELGEEQEQLRKVQEQITELKIEDLSDRQLKTLAIRWKPSDSLFGDLFGSGDNPYTKELARRIRAEKEIEKELDEARKQKPEESIFDF
jgi:hypothetical protein